MPAERLSARTLARRASELFEPGYDPYNSFDTRERLVNDLLSFTPEEPDWSRWRDGNGYDAFGNHRPTHLSERILPPILRAQAE